MSTVYKDGNYLTEKGRALIAKCMASETEIVFTKATVGSGSLPEDTAPKQMTSLSKYEVDGVLSEISSPHPGEVQTVFQVFSRDVRVGFLATEAAIWAMDPDEGEILYTYIVINNEPEFIRSSDDPVQKFAEFTCINIIGAAAADMTVVNPSAIATKGMLDALQKQVDEIDPMARNAASALAGDIVIPHTGWQESPAEAPDNAYYVDVPIEGITEDMTPIVTIQPGSMAQAYEVHMNSAARALADKVRFYADSVPDEDMNASILVVATGASIGGGGTHYVLPPATATRLGGVKIGNGVHVEADGTISVDADTLLEDYDVMATDEEVEEVINN